VFLIYFVAGESLSSKSPRPTPVAIAQLIGKHTKRSQWVLVGLSLFFSIPREASAHSASESPDQRATKRSWLAQLSVDDDNVSCEGIVGKIL
jgi:hypothetical protein